MKKSFCLFTDASISPQAELGIGAYLNLEEEQLTVLANMNAYDLLLKVTTDVTYISFNSKKSTWTEIKTIIHALNSIPVGSSIKIYTDCQSFCDLLGKRKAKLEKNNFLTQTGKVLANADLYKEIYDLATKLEIQAFKIKGHCTKKERVTIEEKIFSILDQLTRKKLREIIKK